MFALPTELDIADFSVVAMVDQSEFGMLPGESGILAMLRGLKRPLRGIIMPRPPIMGDESGDDCSARVE